MSPEAWRRPSIDVGAREERQLLLPLQILARPEKLSVNPAISLDALRDP
jgi:hypothetical protein